MKLVVVMLLLTTATTAAQSANGRPPECDAFNRPSSLGEYLHSLPLRSRAMAAQAQDPQGFMAMCAGMMPTNRCHTTCSPDGVGGQTCNTRCF